MHKCQQAWCSRPESFWNDQYVAVFEGDVSRHYREQLEHRRQNRPTDEFRDAASDDWTEFHEHFDRRQGELDICGQRYRPPCQHEHACIRCPMLHVDPEMLAQLPPRAKRDETSRRASCRDALIGRERSGERAARDGAPAGL